ncbi:putative cAMP-specific 3',5'-cyclic phosphodiesterase [Neospora caninum Liverpool]|uniref:Phosphodiesterase n=1 Tax=Neospora caninum (strain Liverpool) TaxID=572307 RepID=F0VHK5_NEOCL|nr:putative cAMP-specific 3',5'-cyclic phosphodiesterase [Neospora caninum Liverpool]CBZ53199.1 putative cAMP-specific 3',5'-cyclic phosphodiesterase [Neospora caninum Liverpool]CEL67189.1 TPA: cAMP-specific 3',5'-cyclic phosphodiesterase,putative [Neospora caninum Liverpool]|eukprot:XP_003883231.1 putative cAMP-specific 3',5'-cyclic phosphodiesterase [Neospora caninum Liverpool]
MSPFTLRSGAVHEAKMLSVDLEYVGSGMAAATAGSGFAPNCEDSARLPCTEQSGFPNAAARGADTVFAGNGGRLRRRRSSGVGTEDTAMAEIRVETLRRTPKPTVVPASPPYPEDRFCRYLDVDSLAVTWKRMTVTRDAATDSQSESPYGREDWEDARRHSISSPASSSDLSWPSTRAPPCVAPPCLRRSTGGGAWGDRDATAFPQILDARATDDGSIRCPSVATIAMSPSSAGCRSPHAERNDEGVEHPSRELGGHGRQSSASSLQSVPSPTGCAGRPSRFLDTFVTLRSDDSPRCIVPVAVHGKPKPPESNDRVRPSPVSPHLCSASGWVGGENGAASAESSRGSLTDAASDPRKTRSGNGTGRRDHGSGKPGSSEGGRRSVFPRLRSGVNESDVELSSVSPASPVTVPHGSPGNRENGKEINDAEGPEAGFGSNRSKLLQVNGERTDTAQWAGDSVHSESPGGSPDWPPLSRVDVTPMKNAFHSCAGVPSFVPRMQTRKAGAKELPSPSPSSSGSPDHGAGQSSCLPRCETQGRHLRGESQGPVRRYISRFLEMWGGDDWGSTCYESFQDSRSDGGDAIGPNRRSSSADQHLWNSARRCSASRAQAACFRNRTSSADSCLMPRAGQETLESPSRGALESRHRLPQSFGLVRPASFQLVTDDALGDPQGVAATVECNRDTCKATQEDEMGRKLVLYAEENRGNRDRGRDHATEHSGRAEGLSGAAISALAQVKPRHEGNSSTVWKKKKSSPLAFEYKDEEEAYRQYLNRLFPFRLTVVGLVLLLVEILQISWRLVQRSFLVDSRGEYSYYGLVNFDRIFIVIAVCLVIHIIIYGLLAAGGRIPGVKNRLESWSFSMIVVALTTRICGMVCVAFMGEGIGTATILPAADEMEPPTPFISEPRALSSELVLLSLCCLFHIIVIDMMLPIRTLPSVGMHTIHILGCIGCCVLSVCLYPQCISSDGPICAVSTCLFIVCGFLGRAQMEVAHRQLYMRWKHGLERLRAAEQKLHSHRTSKTGIEQLAMLVRQSQVLLRHACVSGASRHSKQLALEQVTDIQGQVLDIVTNVNNLYHAKMNTEEMSELLRFVPEGQDDAHRSLLRDWRGRSASFSGCERLRRDSEASNAGVSLSVPLLHQNSTCSTLCVGSFPSRTLPFDGGAPHSTAFLSSRFPEVLAGQTGLPAPEGVQLGETGKSLKGACVPTAENPLGAHSPTGTLKQERSQEEKPEPGDAPQTVRPEPLLDLPESMKAAIGVDWDLDFFELNERVNNNALLVTAQVQLLPLLRPEGLRCSPHVLRCYLRCLQQQYCPSNPYHNQVHAAMVSHCCLIIVNEILPSKQALTYVDELCLVIASAAHDVGHPGLNNQYLISSQSLLATTYNDIAVLENYHAACCFRTAGINEDHNIFSGLTKEVYQYMRQNIIGLILSTDMSKHISYVSRLRVRAESGNFDVANEGDRWLLFQGCIKAADLAHTATFWENHKRWAECLCEEFFKQGDEERRQGMNVMDIFDRRQKDRFPQSQYRFIELVVEPLFHSVRSIEDLLNGRGGVRGKICKALSANLTRWKEAAEALEKAASNSPTDASGAKTNEEGDGDRQKVVGGDAAEKKEAGRASAGTPKFAGSVAAKTAGDRKKGRPAATEAGWKEAENATRRRGDGKKSGKPEKTTS